MCDQTEVSYLPDDIVWVKLSNVWWPAQVQDETKLDADVTSGLRKKPLAVVKFFDEDLYEFPKNLTQIYNYNCFKKDEFIKRGLGLCRPQGHKEISQNMKKFPLDVKKAEIMTGGNPDIIYDTKYMPEQKYDYREQFGLKARSRKSGSKRMSTESLTETPKYTKVKFSTPISAPSTSRTPDIKVSKTSRSFSNPNKRSKDMKKNVSRKEIINKENESQNLQYHCSYCDYTCNRLGVVIEHYKRHYSGLAFPSPTHIPHNYYKIFQENFLKYNKDNTNSTPVALPKSGSEKPVKRKHADESSPIKKRKYESLKKEKAPSPTPSCSALAVPIKNIVGTTATPKKRSRKSKEIKPVAVKEPEALDILKDWEDDLDEEPEIKLNITEPVEDNIEENTSKNKLSDTLSENDETIQSQPPQEHKSPASKEKCCFDFEDNDESLPNKSLKFGQKLPRVISEEKPNVQRLLKELQESKEESTENEDFTQEFENLLKTTEVPILPDLPQSSSAMDDKPTKSKKENEDFDEEVLIDTISLENVNELEDCDPMKKTSNHANETIQELETVSKNASSNKVEETKNNEEKNNDILPSTALEEDLSEVKNLQTTNLSSLENAVVISPTEIKEEEAEASPDILLSNIAKTRESTINTFESNLELPGKKDDEVNSTTLPSNSKVDSLVIDSTAKGSNKDEIEEKNISCTEKKVKEENVSDMSMIVEDSVENSVEIVNCQESLSCKEEEEIVISNNSHSIQSVTTSEVKQLNESLENDKLQSCPQKVDIIDTHLEINSSNREIKVIGSFNNSEIVKFPLKEELDSKLNINNMSSNIQTPVDQIPFDINSMPIVIDQDPIMEIADGHIAPLPNAEIYNLYIRNRGEEKPEDFQSHKRLLTISPPSPNTASIPGVKKIALPPPKNKNAAKNCTTRYNLSKPPSKPGPTQLQQPQIVYLKSSNPDTPDRLLMTKQQSAVFAPSGKLHPGTRILTTNAQILSKTAVQTKKGISKPIIVGKQGFPTTAKMVSKSVIGQVLPKASSQTIIANKNTSTVLVNNPKIITRPGGRSGIILSSQQLKNTSGVQSTGTKVVIAPQVVKTQTVFQQGETILTQKSVQSTSAIHENKKQSVKNKQPSPNILQKTQRKPVRQPIIKKPQVLTIQQPQSDIVVNSLPIVQSIGAHSSSDNLKMVYLVDSQFSVESPVIPVENDNRNIYVTSTSSSGNMDNLIFSIDRTGNLVNISNPTTSSSSSHTPSQDILAKALADTQVLQSETSDIVDTDNTVYVEQQYPAPSLTNTVLETSLTLNQPPIMTPLEVPSSVTPQSNISHIIPITNITKKSDIQQPSMPLLTDEVEVPGQAVFLSDPSGIPTTSGHLTFQLVHDNNLVVTRNEVKQDFSNVEIKEENVLPEFLKGNFGSKSEISKKDTSPKRSER